MFKFTGYVPAETDHDGFHRVGLNQRSYMEQAGIESMMDKNEKLIGQTILINDKPYRVFGWELEEGFVVSVKPVEGADAVRN